MDVCYRSELRCGAVRNTLARALPGAEGRAQTMSFRPLSARTLTFVVAGLAAISINSPGLNGFGTPFLALRAGTRFLSILTRPGRVNEPAPRRPRLLEIWALSASKTPLTA